MNFDDIFRQFKMWEDLINSPAQRMIRDIENQRRYMQPMLDAAERAREYEKYFINNNYLTHIKDFKNTYSKWHSAIDTVPITTFQDNIRAVIDNIDLPALYSIADQWQKTLNDTIRLEQFSNSFGGQILEQLHQIAGVSDSISAEREVDILDKLLIEKLSQLPRIHLSKEAIVQIILSIVFFVVSIFSSIQSEDNINSKIDEMGEMVLERLHETESRLLNKFDDIKALDKQNHYVAIDHVNLSPEPFTSSYAIYTLTPNMIVEIIGISNDWIHIQFIDYVEGSLKEGWALEKNFVPASEDDEND